MPNDKKILATLAALGGVLISILLGANGFFLVRVFDKIDRTYDKATDAGQAVAVLTARFDTYVQYKKGHEEDVTYGQSLRKRVRYTLIEGI